MEEGFPGGASLGSPFIHLVFGHGRGSITSGSRVNLSIKANDKKAVTVPARMIEGKQDGAGVVTSVVNGVTWSNFIVGMRN
jgi:hypothetical protein